MSLKVLILFCLMASAIVIFLWFQGVRDRTLILAAALVGTAFLVRAAVMGVVSDDYIFCLAPWVSQFRENGGWAIFKEPLGDYNVPYLYFLAAISYLPFNDLILIKLFSIVFDVGLAWGGYRLVTVLAGRDDEGPSISAVAAFCLLLLLPTVVLNGAFWGQCDVIYSALCLNALACALDGKPRLSIILLAIAFSFKLQSVFLIPLWCALWFTGRVKFRHFALFPLTYFITILPALLLGKPLGDILGVYLGQTSEYTNVLTANAPSVYAFIPYQTEVNGAIASKVGIIAAFALVAALLLALFRFRKLADDRLLVFSAALLVLGIPFLLPYMHERYFFLAEVILLILACTDLYWSGPAALVQCASLSTYLAFFGKKLTPSILIPGGGILIWGLEALFMLSAFAITGWMLVRALLQCTRPAKTQPKDS